MPPTTFGALGVPGQLTRVLYERGIEEPFPIQAATLPDALAGKDVCGRAPTGSGGGVETQAASATASTAGAMERAITANPWQGHAPAAGRRRDHRARRKLRSAPPPAAWDRRARQRACGR